MRVMILVEILILIQLDNSMMISLKWNTELFYCIPIRLHLQVESKMCINGSIEVEESRVHTNWERFDFFIITFSYLYLTLLRKMPFNE